MDAISTCYSGHPEESFDDFIEDFRDAAARQKFISSDELKLLFPSFLKGGALYYFREIKSTTKTFEEVVTKFKEEFDVADYAAQFYNAKQDKRNLLDHFHYFSELARKAGIEGESVFITQFLKGLRPFYKNKLVTSHFVNRKALKTTLIQMEKIYPENKEEEVNISRNPATFVPNTASCNYGGGDHRHPASFSSPMQGHTQDPRRVPSCAPSSQEPNASRIRPNVNTYNLRSRQSDFRQRRP